MTDRYAEFPSLRCETLGSGVLQIVLDVAIRGPAVGAGLVAALLADVSVAGLLISARWRMRTAPTCDLPEETGTDADQAGARP